MGDEGAAGIDIPGGAAAAGETSPLADIRFEYDSASLTDEARATLEKHALWLQGRRDVRVTVEGHCDERGTVDYNLALGEQRARAARDYLVGPETRVVCDRPEDFSRLTAFARTFAPERERQIELYREAAPIFYHFGVEGEVERALERRVWLKSGGTIVLDEAEVPRTSPTGGSTGRSSRNTPRVTTRMKWPTSRNDR